jgi:Rrf2 family iron-sulfur cluster assembly transcriptional regulator
MQLNTKGRYAVMAMADVAMHSVGNSIAVADIACRQKISQAYLEQLFSKLRRAGVVESVRGPGGGYKLADRADKITVLQIMNAVGEPIEMTRCKEAGLGCIGGEHCITHDLWQGLGWQVVDFLGGVSLADVVNRKIPDKFFRNGAGREGPGQREEINEYSA